jgi:hypothetical protein
VPDSQQGGDSGLQPVSSHTQVPVSGGNEPTTPGILSALACVMMILAMACVPPCLGWKGRCCHVYPEPPLCVSATPCCSTPIIGPPRYGRDPGIWPSSSHAVSAVSFASRPRMVGPGKGVGVPEPDVGIAVVGLLSLWAINRVWCLLRCSGRCHQVSR